MKTALRSLRVTFGTKVHIMAGNVATLEGYNDLVDWGADSVRCNIGGGSICSTRVQTGHGVPGFHTIVDCARSDRNVPIIADGESVTREILSRLWQLGLTSLCLALSCQVLMKLLAT